MDWLEGANTFLAGNPRLTVWLTIATFLMLAFGSRFCRRPLGVGVTLLALVVFMYTVTIIHLPWLLILGLGFIAIGVNLVRRYRTISVVAGVMVVFVAVFMKNMSG